ncbi:MAG: SDR family NAD(P)-dependent oxidoreductase [Candidatus Sericytochromatia bacterium]
MDTGLKGKRAIVTGGGRGIGKEIALNLASEGVKVCVLSRTEEELKSVCEEILDKGGNACYKVFDLVSGDYQKLKSEISEEVGNIDILVNNAAKPSKPQKLSFLNDEEWYKVIETDLNSQFKIIKQFINDMRDNKWGRIVIIGSLSGMFGASGYSAYCTVKSGLEGLTKNLAVDYSKYGITINMVSPGFVETERFKKAAPEEMVQKFISATSTKRLAKPKDIANAVTFLSSDLASYITGVNLPVCGGLNLGNLW